MTVLTDVPGLRTLLGSFWSDVFEGHAQLDALLAGLALCGQQLELDAAFEDAAISRREIAPYRRAPAFPIRLRESDRDTGTPNIRRLTGADMTGYQLGAPDGTYVGFPLPDGLRDFSVITSRLENPDYALFNGIDVWVDTDLGLLVFRADPFSTSDVVPAAPGPAREIVVWAHDALLERRDVFSHHGFAFGFDEAEDSVVQKTVMAPYADCVALGSTAALVRELVAAATRVNPETFGPDGDVEICDCRHGRPPAWLTTLTIEAAWLTDGDGPIWIDNTERPVRSYVSDGLTRVDIGVRGEARSVRHFTDELNRRCEARGTTLLSVLGAWRGITNPTSVNPAEFVLSNALRGALVLVRIDTPVNDAYGRHLSRLVRVVPPYLLLQIITTLRHIAVEPRIGPATATLTLAMNLVTESGVSCAGSVLRIQQITCR
ncbi:MAG: hypothetical protein E6Q97_26675 [Desulfurellales bacterium]|nr:MAG: hypothetical protein E6Q97_26675 [Desulfurellales bacterium]